MDPTVLGALVTTGAAMVGGTSGWVVGRTRRTAEVAKIRAEADAAKELATAHRADGMESLAATVADLSEEVRRLRAEHAQLDQRNRELGAEVAHLRTRLESHDVNEQRLIGENARLRELLATREAELAAATAEVERLRAVVAATAHVTAPPRDLVVPQPAPAG